MRLFWLGAAREQTGLEQHFGESVTGQKMLVAAQSIEYLRVLAYSKHPITVALWIGKLGGSSLELHYEVFDNSLPEKPVVARAITTLVVVDGQSLRPQRLSAAARAAVASWQDEPLRLGR